MHWWHNICGMCGKRVAPHGQPFCETCDAEVEAEIQKVLKEGGDAK